MEQGLGFLVAVVRTPAGVPQRGKGPPLNPPS